MNFHQDDTPLRRTSVMSTSQGSQKSSDQLFGPIDKSKLAGNNLDFLSYKEYQQRAYKYAKMAERKYSPTDLLDLDCSSKRSWQKRLRAAVKDFQRAMDFRSITIEKFYYESYIKRTKRHVRILLKYVLLYYFVIEISSPMIYPTNVGFIRWHFVYVMVFLGAYLLTVSEAFFFQYYDYFCTTAVVLVLSSHLLSVTAGYSSPEIEYTPSALTIIVFYAFMPTNLNSIILIAIVFNLSLLIIAKREYDFHDHQSPAKSFYDLLQVRGNRSFQGSSVTKENYLYGQVLFWLICHTIGIYLHFCYKLRYRGTFQRLSENIRAMKECKDAYDYHKQLIASIMPACIIDEYLELQALNRNKEDMWIYNKEYSDVTVLFADIVGFTKMSGNKTAIQVVMLLNDLFNRFDELSNITSCEKIGTLGDCYYCVSGCPIANPKHASACVEMGLGMCRIIKMFNIDHKESVNMRVGVHTGRVNAAIIGIVRFRFDVYSFDVIIANQMESSGKPGLVHVSESTYKATNAEYKFVKSRPVEIQQEAKGSHGMELKTRKIATYFVDPKSSLLLKKGIEDQNTKAGLRQIKLSITAADERTIPKFPVVQDLGKEQRVSSPTPSPTLPSTAATDATTTATAAADATGAAPVPTPAPPSPPPPLLTLSSQDTDTKGVADDFEFDVHFVNMIKKDKEGLFEKHSQPPIWPLTMKFVEEEMESYYKAFPSDLLVPMYVDSIKIIPFFDSLFVFVFLLLLLIMIFFFSKECIQTQTIYILCLIVFEMLLCCLLTWRTFNVSRSLPSYSTKYVLFKFLSHWLVNDILTASQHLGIQLLPLLCWDCSRIYRDYYYTAGLFSITYITSLTYLFRFSTRSYSNHCLTIAITIVYLYHFIGEKPCPNIPHCSSSEGECQNFPCQAVIEMRFDRSVLQDNVLFLIYFLTNILLVSQMSTESERCERMVVYVERQAKDTGRDAKDRQTLADQLLYNIIPVYVMNSILSRQDSSSKLNFNYAVSLEHVAVIFARLNNFFDGYYREDFKGGEAALMLLNKVITTFDELIPEYRNVEKIKSSNDLYMAAAGLNTLEVCQNVRRHDHCFSLMHYAFAMRKALGKFNKDYLLDYAYIITIGYNIGPVTAGIIGENRLMYDIWGNTVNVASRMYSTANKGMIQVPEETSRLLAEEFEFEYNDIVDVKGKGQMVTFTCLGPKTK